MRKYIDLYFTTVTVQNWYPLLRDDVNKEILIDAFRFVVNKQRAQIWAFVIMDTHFHIVWQILAPNKLCEVQRDLLKFTAQMMRKRILDEGNESLLRRFITNASDRYVQIWKRRSLSIEIYYDNVLQQKVNYIHNNVRKKGGDDVLYKYSSAFYYATGIRNWDFL